MARVTAIAAVILLMFAVVAAHADPTTDKSGAFTIEIATGWTAQDGTDLINASGPKDIAQLSVTKEAMEGITFDQFAKVYAEQLGKQLKGFKLISKGKTSIDGASGGVWTYTAVFDKIKLQFKNYVVFKDDTMYVTVVGTLPQRFATDAAALDKMVKSWKWL